MFVDGVPCRLRGASCQPKKLPLGTSPGEHCHWLAGECLGCIRRAPATSVPRLVSSAHFLSTCGSNGGRRDARGPRARASSALSKGGSCGGDPHSLPPPAFEVFDPCFDGGGEHRFYGRHIGLSSPRFSLAPREPPAGHPVLFLRLPSYSMRH